MPSKIVVIGAGPGGYTAAIRLAQLGQAVTLVEKNDLGGECLNCGCIPSKAFISAAHLFYKAKNASSIGIEMDNPRINFSQLQAWKKSLIGNLSRGIAALLKGNNVSVVRGEASFASVGRVGVQGAQAVEIDFDQAIIATGSKPIDLPGLAIDGKRILGSKEALELETLPRSLLIIGGGVIGLELGIFFAKLGTQVGVVELTGALLPGVDPELTTPVSRTLKKLGATVYLNSSVSDFQEKDGHLEWSVKTSEGVVTVAAEKALVSVGRKPNIEGLRLDEIGIARDKKGFIAIDENFKTSADGIYAIGDVTGGPYLAHRASHQALELARLMTSGAKGKRASIPSAIFTDPEIAFVGLSEAEAKEKNQEVLVGKFPFAASGRALASRESDGFVKVIADKATKKILGAAIVGPNASDLISEASLAIGLGATLEDISSIIHPHPTLPESFFEAAEASLGQAIHIVNRTHANPGVSSFPRRRESRLDPRFHGDDGKNT